MHYPDQVFVVYRITEITMDEPLGFTLIAAFYEKADAEQFIAHQDQPTYIYEAIPASPYSISVPGWPRDHTSHTARPRRGAAPGEGMMNQTEAFTATIKDMFSRLPADTRQVRALAAMRPDVLCMAAALLDLEADEMNSDELTDQLRMLAPQLPPSFVQAMTKMIRRYLHNTANMWREMNEDEGTRIIRQEIGVPATVDEALAAPLS